MRGIKKLIYLALSVSAAPQLRPYLHVFDAETSSDDIVATAELPSTVEIQPFETPAVSPPAASAITSPLDTGGVSSSYF